MSFTLPRGWYRRRWSGTWRRTWCKAERGWPIDQRSRGDRMKTALTTRDTDCRNNRKLMIHAANVRAYGAQQVVVSLLDALAALGSLRASVVAAVSKEVGRKAADWQAIGAEICFYRRVLPNSVSRLLECLFTRRAGVVFALPRAWGYSAVWSLRANRLCPGAAVALILPCQRLLLFNHALAASKAY